MEVNIKNWLTQIKKGYLDLCILMVIEEDEKTYGFQLLSQLQELNLSLKEGTLYPLLNRMTKEELLKANWETEGIKGHPRKFYSLTQKGFSHLKMMEIEFESMYQTFNRIKNTEGDINAKHRA